MTTTSEAGGESIETRLLRLEDIEAIRRLKVRQMSALDAIDPVGVSNVYTEDALWEGGGQQRNGRAGVLKAMTGNMSRTPWFFHVVENAEIDVAADGLRATGNWKLLEWSQTSGTRHWMLGRFEDRYRKEDGQWLIEYSHWSCEVLAEVQAELPTP
jgi:uncharacterized protein (TIGR02246 family)